MHKTTNQREEILLATKTVLPEFYQMNQKEVMYTNTVRTWKTSVTRFIQGLGQQDLLDLQKMIVYKKRADEAYPISDQHQTLYKNLRVDHESLVGIAAE